MTGQHGRSAGLPSFNEKPFCAFCAAQDRTTASTVADHIIPHKGDLDLFWFGELQSLCEPCHSIAKQPITVTWRN
jgi:5-methylcytosine-specific restriction protein A